jgi:RimJ/RimL family protein N-acetyltransferase
VELAGELVRLRPRDEADLGVVSRYTSDLTVTRYTGWTSQTREEAERYFRKALVTSGGTQDYLPFVITAGNSNGLIGMIDLEVRDRVHQRAEVGYGLLPEYWGHGYATDALRCLVRHALARDDLYRIEATCHPENLRSGQVLERAGFLYEG